MQNDYFFTYKLFDSVIKNLNSINKFVSKKLIAKIKSLFTYKLFDIEIKYKYCILQIK